jgi:hypothetical protein
MTTRALMAMFALVLLLGAPAIAPAALEIPWWTVDGGGQTFSTGGTFELGGTIGQPDASLTVMTGGTFELSGGFWVSGIHIPATCLGDMNCDGLITFADIDWFVEALAGESSWAHAPCPWSNADINHDVIVTFADIDPFVLLIGTTCP